MLDNTTNITDADRQIDRHVDRRMGGQTDILDRWLLYY